VSAIFLMVSESVVAWNRELSINRVVLGFRTAASSMLITANTMPFLDHYSTSTKRSTWHPKSTPSIGRPLGGWVALSLVLIAFLAVQIQQRMLRWRAERLLAEIHQTRLYQSTWADAQQLMHRWGAWGHADLSDSGIVTYRKLFNAQTIVPTSVNIVVTGRNPPPDTVGFLPSSMLFIEG
jgi:hypothetical protein